MYFQIETTPEKTCLVFHGDKEGFEALKKQSEVIDPKNSDYFITNPIRSFPERCLSLLEVIPKKVLGEDELTPFSVFPPSYKKNTITKNLRIRWYESRHERVLHASWNDDFPVLHINEHGWADWQKALSAAVNGPYWFFLTYSNPLISEEKHLFLDRQTVRAAVKKENGIIPAIAFVRTVPESVPSLSVFQGFLSRSAPQIFPGIIKGNVIGQQSFLGLLENAIAGFENEFELPYRDEEKLHSGLICGKTVEVRVRPQLLKRVRVHITATDLAIEVSDNCMLISGNQESLVNLLNIGKKLLWTYDEEQISGTLPPFAWKEDVKETRFDPNSSAWPWVWRGGLLHSLYDPVDLSWLDSKKIQRSGVESYQSSYLALNYFIDNHLLHK